MDKGRVGEDRGSKETDRCPLTTSVFSPHAYLPLDRLNIVVGTETF
jgi:hypothetical protein